VLLGQRLDEMLDLDAVFMDAQLGYDALRTKNSRLKMRESCSEKVDTIFAHEQRVGHAGIGHCRGVEQWLLDLAFLYQLDQA
jgi:hypothetical protein